MPAKTLQKGGKPPSLPTGQRRFVSASLLQQHYATATNGLGTHFPMIDVWLAEHAPDLWRQIRQEDDELFRLCQLGVPERTFQDKLDAFLALCEQAERLYYETQPNELRLPSLAKDERVAIYYELADGSLHKASEEEK